jgi:hypothetical protein
LTQQRLAEQFQTASFVRVNKLTRVACKTGHGSSSKEPLCLTPHLEDGDEVGQRFTAARLVSNGNVLRVTLAPSTECGSLHEDIHNDATTCQG